jgi:iron complex outermembrane receptor protein
LPSSFEVDVKLRHLTDIKNLPSITTSEGIPGYSELDVRLAWHGSKQLEISIVGQNLLHDRHGEFGAPAARGEIQRSVYGKVAWGF